MVHYIQYSVAVFWVSFGFVQFSKTYAARLGRWLCPVFRWNYLLCWVRLGLTPSVRPNVIVIITYRRVRAYSRNVAYSLQNTTIQQVQKKRSTECHHHIKSLHWSIVCCFLSLILQRQYSHLCGIKYLPWRLQPSGILPPSPGLMVEAVHTSATSVAGFVFRPHFLCLPVLLKIQGGLLRAVLRILKYLLITMACSVSRVGFFYVLCYCI
jgi:hypothetical protein